MTALVLKSLGARLSRRIVVVTLPQQAHQLVVAQDCSKKLVWSPLRELSHSHRHDRMGKEKVKVSSDTIIFVTRNYDKLREVEGILGSSFPYKIINVELDLVETQGEPDEISRLKCKSAFQLVQAPVLTEDTCLSCTALGGLPGPYVKCFLRKVGRQGLHKMLQGFGDDYSATFSSTLAYCDGDTKDIKLFKGMTTGTIISRPGDDGIGFHVNFQPDGCAKGYLEMSAAEKNQVSHRRKAVDAMKEYFLK